MSDTPQSPTHGHIVVGTDLSPRTGPAIEWAAKRADAAGVPLLVTLVVPPGPLLLRNGIDDAAIVGDGSRYHHGDHSGSRHRSRAHILSRPAEPPVPSVMAEASVLIIGMRRRISPRLL